MRILFCSNYFTHHQIPLSDALYELTNHNYCFVAHKEMDAERKDLGWGNDLVRPYTCSASDQEVQKQLNDLDVLIAGSFPERQTKASSLFATLPPMIHPAFLTTLFFLSDCSKIFKLLHHFGWDTGHHRIRRHIFRNTGTGCDHTSIPNARIQ